MLQPAAGAFSGAQRIKNELIELLELVPDEKLREPGTFANMVGTCEMDAAFVRALAGIFAATPGGVQHNSVSRRHIALGLVRAIRPGEDTAAAAPHIAGRAYPVYLHTMAHRPWVS